MKIFALPEDLRNDILAYLHEQPYKDVAQGVARLTALSEVPEAPPPEPEKKKED